MSSSAVRAGGVFVEIGADPRKFFAALNKVNKSLAHMGGALVSGGGRLAAAGAGMFAPIAAAVQQGTKFESVLLGIRASTGATSAEIGKIRDSAMEMSRALGVGPTEAAGGMLELLKAGMSLDKVLGGAGKTALEFAKVGEMDVGQAAVVMSDAMNVFKVSADVAANALSSAADASSTSISQMSEAFSMSSAVAGKAGLTIEDLSATLAILANNGVKGSDAGTSVKTMLMRLMAPASEAADAMKSVGLSVRSFVDQDTGKMLPMVEIIGKLNDAMKPLDEVAKKELLAKIFGADAIRAALILGDVGTEGFDDIRKAMASALPVGEKYKILMSGLAGAGGSILAAMQRLAIAIAGAVGPALSSVVPAITGFIDGLTKLATDNKEAVVLFAKLAVSAIGVGGAMIGLGYSLKGLSAVIGGVLKGFGLFAALANPVLLVAAGIGAAALALYKFKDQIGAALGSVSPLVQQAAGAIGSGFNTAVSDGMVVLGDLYGTAQTTFTGIYDAIAAGDLSGAMDVLWAGLTAGWLRGTEALMSYVDPWMAAFQDAFTIMGAEIYKGWDALWVTVQTSLNTAGAVLLGVTDNIINPILAAWDFLEAAIRKSWIRISGIFKDGDAKKAELDKVDAEMKGRAERRGKERPGIVGRMDKAARENSQSELDMVRRRDAIDAATQETIAGRESALGANAEVRRQATLDAEGRLQSLVGGKNESGDSTAPMSYGPELPPAPTSSTSSQSPDDIASTMESTLAGLNSHIQAFAPPPPPDTTLQGSVVGTFSSTNLGQMFGGSSLAERTAKATEEVAKNTRKIGDGDKVAA